MFNGTSFCNHWNIRFPVDVLLCVYIYTYVNIQRSRKVPIPPFGNSSKVCIHSHDWQQYHHNWQHTCIYLMYILLSCTSLIIKDCPASTHNLCQSNVNHSVLKQVCTHTKLQLGVIYTLNSKRPHRSKYSVRKFVGF